VAPIKEAPSAISPASTRVTESLPPGRCAGLHHDADRIRARLQAEAGHGGGDARRLVAQRLHQAEHAIGARGRADQYRAIRPSRSPRDRRTLNARRLDILEQLLHQLVVMVGELLQHGEKRFLLALGVFALDRNDLALGVLAVNEGALEREIDEALDDVVLPDRNLPQHQRHARGRLQERDGLAHALVDLVDFVQEQKARKLQFFELAQHQLQLRDFLLVGFADHDRGVDRRQRRAHVLGKLDGARAVQERIGVAEERCGGDRKLGAHPVGAGLGAGVADRVAGFDGAGPLQHAGAGEDRFEQRGFAGLKRAHDRDATGPRRSAVVGSLSVRHGRLPRPGTGIMRASAHLAAGALSFQRERRGASRTSAAAGYSSKPGSFSRSQESSKPRLRQSQNQSGRVERQIPADLFAGHVGHWAEFGLACADQHSGIGAPGIGSAKRTDRLHAVNPPHRARARRRRTLWGQRPGEFHETREGALQGQV
jgi:hypothetical protein